MCGICGYTGREIPGILNTMLDSISHRGPNDRGIFNDKNINLGMVRLSIIDIEGGHQPISNEDETIWIVFNGEIYNYIEIRNDLQKKGHKFKTFSDTETIVHGFEEYGLSLPHKLNGMFSICIWDKKKDELILIRDRYGVKPLFYLYNSEKLLFGSEIKALLCFSNINNDLDYEALSYYFSLRNIPSPYTIYKEIRSLLPGTMLIWKNNKINISKWYRLSMEVKWSENDENILVEMIDEILRDSVRIRLRSDVDYGAYLSGGIDSSTIVGIMSELSSKPIKTFCLSFADSPEHKQDAYYAKKVAMKYSTDHHEFIMSWNDLKNEMLTIIRHLDQPFAGVISSYWLSKYMKQFVTVALSGDGADDLFASYGHHRLVWPIKAVQEALRNGRSIDDVDYGFFNNRKEFVLKNANYLPWEWRLSYAAFMEHEKELLFSKIGREIFLSYSTKEFLRKIYNECDCKSDELNNMLYLDINTLLHNEILYFNDMLSMVNSMEVRTPFLDYRIAELACSIPGKLKIKNLILKYILRKVATRYVPKEILERSKEGFVLPKNTWLRGGMLQDVKDILSEDRLSIHGFFNYKYINSLIDAFEKGDDTLTFKVWTLMVFEIWYENYINSK